jgi:hypothetical protein
MKSFKGWPRAPPQLWRKCHGRKGYGAHSNRGAQARDGPTRFLGFLLGINPWKNNMDRWPFLLVNVIDLMEMKRGAPDEGRAPLFFSSATTLYSWSRVVIARRRVFPF